MYSEGMARRRDMQDDIRSFHGADVEIVEMEPAAVGYRETGKRYVVSKPDPLAGWPGWLKAMFGLLAFVVLSAGLVASLVAAGFGLFGLWTLFGPHSS